ncbi:hypothetical protein ES288_A02G178300v1 [Gossypium darwinii]|uniref:Uncharacterized protein n=1 Tax=Gossypium darwinii TaxID=34276 RepID=A0A5D2HFC6_GOSDA|nr:hypothetical protein ES288_A02G178300v1 [Gossypium darwinii]
MVNSLEPVNPTPVGNSSSPSTFLGPRLPPCSSANASSPATGNI